MIQRYFFLQNYNFLWNSSALIMLEAKGAFYLTAGSWEWKGFVFFCLSLVSWLELTRVPHNQKDCEVAQILQDGQRNLVFWVLSSSLGSSRFGSVRNQRKNKNRRDVLIQHGGWGTGSGEDGAQWTLSGILPGLLFWSESGAYDLIVWEVFIYFICDIYLIATNIHL